MPRPCAVEFHACSYRTKPHNCRRCHGLAPWSFTLAATEQNLTTVGDATALRRGVSRLQLQNKTSQLSEIPRPCAVEFHACSYRTKLHNCRRCHGLAPWSFTLKLLVIAARVSAGNVSLHGTRPWHPQQHSEVSL